MKYLLFKGNDKVNTNKMGMMVLLFFYFVLKHCVFVFIFYLICFYIIVAVVEGPGRSFFIIHQSNPQINMLRNIFCLWTVLQKHKSESRIFKPIAAPHMKKTENISHLFISTEPPFVSVNTFYSISCF